MKRALSPSCFRAPKLESASQMFLMPAAAIVSQSARTRSSDHWYILLPIAPVPHSQKAHLKGQPRLVS